MRSGLTSGLEGGEPCPVRPRRRQVVVEPLHKQNTQESLGRVNTKKREAQTARRSEKFASSAARPRPLVETVCAENQAEEPRPGSCVRTDER